MTSLRPTAEHATARRFWPLAIVLYPFVVMTVAINLFMFGLIGTWVGLGSIPPVSALIWSLILGLPADYAATRWIQRLIDRAGAS